MIGFNQGGARRCLVAAAMPQATIQSISTHPSRSLNLLSTRKMIFPKNSTHGCNGQYMMASDDGVAKSRRKELGSSSVRRGCFLPCAPPSQGRANQHGICVFQCKLPCTPSGTTPLCGNSNGQSALMYDLSIHCGQTTNRHRLQKSNQQQADSRPGQHSIERQDNGLREPQNSNGQYPMHTRTSSPYILIRKGRLLQFLPLLVAVLFQFAASSVHAKDYSFSWSANPEPLTGYKFYYKKDGNSAPPYNGTDAAEGASPIVLGKQTNFTITGLDENAIYHFTLTAYHDTKESGYTSVITVNSLPSPVWTKTPLTILP